MWRETNATGSSARDMRRANGMNGGERAASPKPAGESSILRGPTRGVAKPSRGLAFAATSQKSVLHLLQTPPSSHEPVIVNTAQASMDPLASQALAEGGWGYVPGQPPHLEPTCLALLALSHEKERYADAIAKGRKFIDECALADGSYRLASGRGGAVWATSLVLFTLAKLGEPADSLKRTATWLLGQRGRVLDHPEAGELQDIDIKLIGWPWAEYNFSWVEPTAWACLALRAVGQANHPRVQEGHRLLLDRARDEGGINYGNRRVLGKMTDPIPTTTALMLLALQGQQHPRIASAVDYLTQQIDTPDLE